MNAEAETPEPHNKMPARALGLFLILLGVGLTAGCYAMAEMSGGFLAFGAWLGPFAFFLGLGSVIEGPKLPVQKLGKVMGGATALGAVAGVGNVIVLKVM